MLNEKLITLIIQAKKKLKNDNQIHLYTFSE